MDFVLGILLIPLIGLGLLFGYYALFIGLPSVIVRLGRLARPLTARVQRERPRASDLPSGARPAELRV